MENTEISTLGCHFPTVQVTTISLNLLRQGRGKQTTARGAYSLTQMKLMSVL